MPPITLRPWTAADLEAIAPLVEESQAEGFRFLQRLVDEYRRSVNRFERPGECLWIALAQGAIAGIGGLSRDPYSDYPAVGRLRHVYVGSAYRGQGIGRLLVTALLQAAQPFYQHLTLRTDTAAAAAFYERLGFKTQPPWPQATHHLTLGQETLGPGRDETP